MESDYYKTLQKRVVTKVSDGAGSYTETLADTDFQGFIGTLSGYEVIKSQQMKVNATARLLTAETLSVLDRVVDGSTVYEVVYAYNDFSKYYDLKLV